ncbi:MAG: redox-sensing transcriptional repressor Rex [Deltaproteobacteria bacterium]|nr:redox-sensing transcriptional repressor Rex [Deltaproteobacteria bacterium]
MPPTKPKSPKIPKIAVIRLALYAKHLEILHSEGVKLVSSLELADLCGVNPAQIRKDLAYFGQFGTRGLGYPVAELLAELKRIMGTDHVWRLGLVGVGNLGRALLRHTQFAEQGFVFTAAFDRNPEVVGTLVSGVKVSNAEQMKRVVRERSPFDIGVLATQPKEAQSAADRLVEAGVSAILNFTPVKLKLPAGVYVENVDFTVRLHLLCYSITHGSDVTQEHPT